MSEKYKNIVQHYEQCYKIHGDNHKGVDWPNEHDAQLRYQIMIDVIKYNIKYKQSINTLLDFGCGTAHLLEYIRQNNVSSILYSGLDLSDTFIAASRLKFPNNEFILGDVLNSNFTMKKFDYIVLNGVFTEKRELTYEEMLAYFKTMLSKIFSYCNKGIAFNVMSKNVDWERDDLFHLSHDVLTAFLCKNLSRHYIIRNDYGLYEYTIYLYK